MITTTRPAQAGTMHPGHPMTEAVGRAAWPEREEIERCKRLCSLESPLGRETKVALAGLLIARMLEAR